jgi:DNA polymerase III delta prime subunit
LVWRTVIEEGEDPSKAMGDMREAFNDLNGAASLDNKASSLTNYDLASAILLALPQSFSTLVSALML